MHLYPRNGLAHYDGQTLLVHQISGRLRVENSADFYITNAFGRQHNFIARV